MQAKLRLTRLLEIAAVILLFGGIVAFGGKYFPFKLVDYSVYWSAGSLAVHGGNPYNLDDMQTKHKEAGWTTQDTKMLQYWYPPWTLPVSMPLGFIEYKTSQLLWYLLSIGMVLFSASLLWRVYQGDQKYPWLAWIVGMLFTPTIFALFFGQVSPLILLGMTGFLYLINRKVAVYDLIAGGCAGLLTIKPALFFLFWPALLLWGITQRRWKVLLGLTLAVLCGAVVSVVFNPNIFQEYKKFLSTARVLDWGVPTVGSWLRQALGKDLVLLQFIPLAAGFAWFLYQWRKNRGAWRWEEQIPWLSMVSLITTAFAWTHDQVILLPAIIAATVQIKSSGNKKQAVAFILAWGMFNLYAFFSHLTRDDTQFVWQAPAILIFYLVALNSFRPRVSSESTASS